MMIYKVFVELCIFLSNKIRTANEGMGNFFSGKFVVWMKLAFMENKFFTFIFPILKSFRNQTTFWGAYNKCCY